MEALDNICDPELYMVYEFPPPDMKQGCEAFIMGWERQIEKNLIGREKGANVEHKVCFEISKACQGVDPKNAPRQDSHIMIDGQPVKLGDDGTIKMPEDL